MAQAISPSNAPARFVASDFIPVAAPTSAPTTVPAVIRSTAPASNPAAATAPATPTVCTAPVAFSHLARPLTHLMRSLASNEPVTIVAIGSSSTAGAGASSRDASYPSRLAVELRQRFSGRDITVINRGMNGEETDNMMARFAADVFPAHPQLILWQVGTNSVLRDRPLDRHAEQLYRGIDQLKASGADVVLIDLQYSPAVVAKSETPDMVAQIALAAKNENVDLFQRFAAMRDWSEVQHLPFDTFVAPDKLHMNDWGYACMAKLLANGIAEAVNRPIASVAAQRPH
ncbi:MAG TPA: SGNH/GDSL hydrolase family protein [Xanthobacteraceae bacterium]|nr:SGNH/GDSL hydrolase family protein [Xanthobacteraceae bacterium]